MRGLAALVVVFFHFYIMFFKNQFGSSPFSSFIYPLVAGHESVMLFFVLSGFVLALPLMKEKTVNYPTYVWKRVLRIYGPYLGALGLAIACCAVWHGKVPVFDHGAGNWASPVNLHAVGQAVLFIGQGNDSRYNSTFWSLIHEMRISIAFPFLFALTGLVGSAVTTIAIVVFALIGVQFSNLITVEYMGMFLIGVLLAKHRLEIQRFWGNANPPNKIVFGLASCSLFYGSHLIGGPWWRLGDLPVAIAAGGFIIIGLNSIRTQIILNLSPIRFLGKISYSLYLVHMTVLCALAALLSHRISHVGLLLVYLTTSILLAWGFYFVVEQPFMKLSRRAGTGIVTLQQKEISEVEALQ
jgi:peptidoglycan/LPS O-acetylase OafA/YrhL